MKRWPFPHVEAFRWGPITITRSTVLWGLALGAGALLWSRRRQLSGLAGNPPCRTIHPDHPLHPYKNGVPAVWGSRVIR